MAIQSNLAHAVMQALGSGGVGAHRQVSDDEGTVMFQTAAGSSYVDTIHKAGGNGTSDDTVTVIATWVAPQDTTVTSVHLIGTRQNRMISTREDFSICSVSKSMKKGDAYTVQWVITAAI